MHNGFAIALAWPETLCKQAGSWYDLVMSYFGFNKNGYYAVGHSALVLTDQNKGQCHYFDFGRYHAPYGFGRVRSARTDHDLRIKTKAIFSNNYKEVENLTAILRELYSNESTHGSGAIFGSVVKINFQKAMEYVNQLQEKEFLPYGPFLVDGTNCSRFVNSAILSGKPPLLARVQLQIPPTITPTPMWNVKALGGKICYTGNEISKIPISEDQKVTSSTLNKLLRYESIT